jgi:hypothetical protein
MSAPHVAAAPVTGSFAPVSRAALGPPPVQSVVVAPLVGGPARSAAPSSVPKDMLERPPGDPPLASVVAVGPTSAITAAAPARRRGRR